MPRLRREKSLKPSNPNIKRRKEELLTRYGSPHPKSQQRQLDFCEFQARLLYTVSSRDTDVERSCPPPKTKQNKQQQEIQELLVK